MRYSIKKMVGAITKTYEKIVILPTTFKLKEIREPITLWQFLKISLYYKPPRVFFHKDPAFLLYFPFRSGGKT